MNIPERREMTDQKEREAFEKWYYETYDIDPEIMPIEWRNSETPVIGIDPHPRLDIYPIFERFRGMTAERERVVGMLVKERIKLNTKGDGGYAGYARGVLVDLINRIEKGER